MPLAYVHSLGGGLVYFHPLDGPVDPGFGSGIGGPGIDNSLPWGPGHPGNRPPGSWGGRPDNSLPGGAGHPDNRPPGHPPTVAPGQTLVMVRDPEGIWHYATVDASTPPPKPVPVPPPVYPTGGPVPVPPGGVAGQPLPPTAAPKA